MLSGMRVGVAHHFGWAVAVTASPDGAVVDRRRITLLGPDLPAAPVHHEGGTHPIHATGTPLDDERLTALVATVRASATTATADALGALARSLPGPVSSLSVRAWPHEFPEDVAVLRRPPYESRADSVMYRRVLAEVAGARGWAVHTYDARRVESEAAAVLGSRADEVLHGPRRTLGPPWTKDHRTALAATIVAAAAP
jgi:hypothetical protein